MEPNRRETHESHVTVCVEQLGREDAINQQITRTLTSCTSTELVQEVRVRKMLLVCWHSSDYFTSHQTSLMTVVSADVCVSLIEQ